jgi:hypothetical protein
MQNLSLGSLITPILPGKTPGGSSQAQNHSSAQPLVHFAGLTLGSGCSCTACAGGVMTQNQALESIRAAASKQTSHVLNHEFQHQSKLQGIASTQSIHYSTLPGGIQVATSGDVKFTKPTLTNPTEADKLIPKLQSVINAAYAPSDPSSTDLSVGSSTKAELADAINVDQQNKALLSQMRLQALQYNTQIASNQQPKPSSLLQQAMADQGGASATRPVAIPNTVYDLPKSALAGTRLDVNG